MVLLPPWVRLYDGCTALVCTTATTVLTQPGKAAHRAGHPRYRHKYLTYRLTLYSESTEQSCVLCGLHAYGLPPLLYGDLGRLGRTANPQLPAEEPFLASGNDPRATEDYYLYIHTTKSQYVYVPIVCTCTGMCSSPSLVHGPICSHIGWARWPCRSCQERVSVHQASSINALQLYISRVFYTLCHGPGTRPSFLPIWISRACVRPRFLERFYVGKYLLMYILPK